MSNDQINIGHVADSENFTIGSGSTLTVEQRPSVETEEAVPAGGQAPAQAGQTDEAGADPEPTIGIITALPKEYVAVKALLEKQHHYGVPGRGAGRRYLLGDVPATNGGRHAVVLALADMGNNIAATRASLLLEHFPKINSIMMVGIAGGVPHPDKPDDHVRLGDIVVSNQGGVVQYDFDKETAGQIIHRHPPRPPSAVLLEAVQLLEAAALEKQRPWLKFIDQVLSHLEVSRPPTEADILTDSTDPAVVRPHPEEPGRLEGQPRIHIGPIASANKLLKNPLKRDMLRDKFGVKAVEMEASGVADATWNHEVGYLVVRGICDYCDANKGDAWQAYAAVIAAAYTRALLESMPGQAPAGESTGLAPGRTRLTTPEFLLSFPTIYQRIEARPVDEDVDKAEIIETVQAIEQETAKGRQARARKIEHRLVDLAEMAPDIFELTADYLLTPPAGATPDIYTAVDRAKAEARG